ncbi:MAG: hypothetical protein AAFO94_16975, partial [Bacteroidota bacterium]
MRRGLFGSIGLTLGIASQPACGPETAESKSTAKTTSSSDDTPIRKPLVISTWDNREANAVAMNLQIHG